MRTKTFRTYDQDTLLLMPPSIRDWVDPESLPAFISDLVDDLDLAPFMAVHDEPRGMPPYHPAMMLKVLLYGYAIGVRSSRKLEERLRSDVGFMFLAGGARPGHKAIGEYRRHHLDAFQRLFLDILLLCQEAGLVRLGRVALDGTKVKADASKHKAMSYGRMDEREATLEAEVARILDEAEAIDRAEDELYGDTRGDELPPELRTREGRLRRLREARAALEAEAKEKSGDPDAVPQPKAQRSFTDPDSRIMRSKPDGWIAGLQRRSGRGRGPPGHRGHRAHGRGHRHRFAARSGGPGGEQHRPPAEAPPRRRRLPVGRQPRAPRGQGDRRLRRGPPRTSTPRHRHRHPGDASPRASAAVDGWPAGCARRRVATTTDGARPSSNRSSARSRRPWASAASACGADRRSPPSGTSSAPSTTSPSCSAVAGPDGSSVVGTAPKTEKPSDGPDGDPSSACPDTGSVPSRQISCRAPFTRLWAGDYERKLLADPGQQEGRPV